MKVILAAIHPAPSPQAVSLANAYLKAYLATDEGLAGKVDIELCDLYLSQDTGECAAAILAQAPAAVGFSLYLWNRQKARDIALALRREAPGLVIFAGGPEATADPAGVLGDSPLDYLILGEGEIPFLETMAALASGNTPKGAVGTAFLEEGRLVTLPQRQVRIPDTIPSPYLSGVLDPGQYPGLLWQLSRGCDFACEYCFDFGGKRGVRRFSMERVDAELDLIVRSGVPQVFVLDSTFNVDMKRAKSILRMIRKRAPHIHFHFEVRSEFIDREMARLFAEITCSLQIGLQSADPAVLKGLKRSFNSQEFRSRIALLNESGAVFGFDLIYGLPGDSLAGFRRSLDYALALYPNHLDIFPLAVLPGTPLARRAGEAGLASLPHAPYILLSSRSFSPDAMAESRALAAACDIFYSRGKAVAWFNAVVSALGMAPSEFLGAFSRWLGETAGPTAAEGDFSDEEIWRLQRTFLARAFRERSLEELLPVALDLTDFHYHFGAALLAPPPELPTDRALATTDLLGEHFVLSPSTRLATFNYEIYDLLEAGEIDLRDFVECFSPTGSCAAIYPRGGEILTESLTSCYHSLLQQLDGRSPAGEIATRLGIDHAETASFLEFAAAEGIITAPFPR